MREAESHLLVEITEVVVVGVASTSWIWIGAAGIRWPYPFNIE